MRHSCGCSQLALNAQTGSDMTLRPQTTSPLRRRRAMVSESVTLDG